MNIKRKNMKRHTKSHTWCTAPTNFHFFAKLKQRVLLHFCLSDRSANNKGMDSEHIVIVQYVHDYVRFVSYAPRGQLLLGFGPFPKWVCHPLSVDSKKKGLRYIMSYTRVFYHCFWTSCMRTYLVSWYMGTCCNQWQDTAHKLLVPGIKGRTLLRLFAYLQRKAASCVHTVSTLG